MAETNTKKYCGKGQDITRKINSGFHSMGYHYCRSWSSRNDSRTCLQEKKNKKYSFLIAKTRWEERFWSLEMANVISQTLHKSQNITK